MTDFTPIGNVNCSAVPSGSESVYFDVSSFVINGPAVTFSRRSHFTFVLPSHPGSTQPHRIPVLGPQPLPVLVDRDHRVVERLLHRDAATHRGGVGALGEQPLALPEARRLRRGACRAARRSTRRTRHRPCSAPPRPGAVVRHTRRAVAGTLDEVDARDQRITRQRRKIERQRPPHEAMNHQPMLRRRNVRHAAVIALEVKRVRRNHSLEKLQRRARGSAAGRPRHRPDESLNARLVRRSLAVQAAAVRTGAVIQAGTFCCAVSGMARNRVSAAAPPVRNSRRGSKPLPATGSRSCALSFDILRSLLKFHHELTLSLRLRDPGDVRERLSRRFPAQSESWHTLAVHKCLAVLVFVFLALAPPAAGPDKNKERAGPLRWTRTCLDQSDAGLAAGSFSRAGELLDRRSGKPAVRPAGLPGPPRRSASKRVCRREA